MFVYYMERYYMFRYSGLTITFCKIIIVCNFSKERKAP